MLIPINIGFLFASPKSPSQRPQSTAERLKTTQYVVSGVGACCAGAFGMLLFVRVRKVEADSHVGINRKFVFAF